MTQQTIDRLAICLLSLLIVGMLLVGLYAATNIETHEHVPATLHYPGVETAPIELCGDTAWVWDGSWEHTPLTDFARRWIELKEPQPIVDEPQLSDTLNLNE